MFHPEELLNATIGTLTQSSFGEHFSDTLRLFENEKFICALSSARRKRTETTQIMRSTLARRLLSDFQSLYNLHRQLIDAYVINFHLEKHWEHCVPPDWRQFFDKCLVECADQLPAYLASLLEHEKATSLAHCGSVDVPQSLHDMQCHLHDLSQQMRQLGDEGRPIAGRFEHCKIRNLGQKVLSMKL